MTDYIGLEDRDLFGRSLDMECRQPTIAHILEIFGNANTRRDVLNSLAGVPVTLESLRKAKSLIDRRPMKPVSEALAALTFQLCTPMTLRLAKAIMDEEDQFDSHLPGQALI